MRQVLRRVAKPLGYIAVAAIAAVAFVAASPDGFATVKAAFGNITGSAGSTCGLHKAMADRRDERRSHRITSAKMAANKAGVAVPAVKTAEAGKGCCAGTKAAAAKNAGTCPMTGKAMAGKDAGTCPMSGKAAATPAVNTKADCGECPFAKQMAQGNARGASAAKDLLNVAVADGDFSTFILAAKAAGVINEFQGAEPKTIFAPTNEAFRKLSPETWAALLQDTEKLRAVLARHIVPGIVKAEDMKSMSAAKLGDGQECAVSTCPKSGTVSLGTAKVTRTNIAASNGMIQAIDTVLLPETMTANAAQPQADAVKVAAKS